MDRSQILKQPERPLDGIRPILSHKSSPLISQWTLQSLKNPIQTAPCERGNAKDSREGLALATEMYPREGRSCKYSETDQTFTSNRRRAGGIGRFQITAFPVSIPGY